MKRKLLLLSLLSAVVFTTAKAQDSTLTITGSVDTYYKYSFADRPNIQTSFATDHNSVSIGMIDIALKKKLQKAAFVGEISFGPRGQQQSIVYQNGVDSYHIQNLYVSYDLTDKLVATVGFMGTFIGYEVISPVGNFNYSTSYMFTNGPFQNAGFKLAYTFSDKVSLMAGIFNDGWNLYTSAKKVDNFGAQLTVSPVTGWTAYLNVLTGKSAGTIFDLTTAYQITDAFKLGLNAADFTIPGAAGDGGYTGIALYPQVAVSNAVTLGLRGEYFKTKKGIFGAPSMPLPGESVKALTFTANIKAGPLTVIPEVRLDNMTFDGVVDSGAQYGFLNKSGAGVKSASQASLAFVYAF